MQVGGDHKAGTKQSSTTNSIHFPLTSFNSTRGKINNGGGGGGGGGVSEGKYC